MRELTADGAVSVRTGAFTGRSPKDKFIVRDGLTEDSVWWDNAGAMSPAHFDAAARAMPSAALGGVGAVPAGPAGRRRSAPPVCRHRPDPQRLACAVHPQPADPARRDGARPAAMPRRVTIVHAPHFKADPARHGSRTETVIALDMSRNIVVIAGTLYAGEIKKIGVLAVQFPRAAPGRAADALLGQSGHGWRSGAVLRPVGHRQDHAQQRSGPPADRR